MHFLNGKNSLNMVSYSFETSPIIKYAYSDHPSGMRVFLYLQVSMRVMWVYFLITRSKESVILFIILFYIVPASSNFTFPNDNNMCERFPVL